MRTEARSKGGLGTRRRLSGLRVTDGPAGGGGGGTKDVAVGPAATVVGVPARSSLLRASTFDLRWLRCGSPSSLTAGAGMGMFSGKVMQETNVGLRLRGASALRWGDWREVVEDGGFSLWECIGFEVAEADERVERGVCGF